MTRASAVAAGVIALSAAAAEAAFERPPLGPEAAALGGVIALSPDGVFGNAAGPVSREDGARDLRAVTGRPFGLPELSESQASARWAAAGRVSVGAGFRRFGTAGYVEKELRAVVAVAVAPAVRAGLAARGLEVGGGFPARRSFALDVSFRARADAKTTLGAVIEALAGGVPGGLPGRRSRTSVGMAHRVAGTLLLRLEVQHQGEGPLAGVLGADWHPLRILTLRAGIRDDPAVLSWGVSVRIGALTVSGAASHTRDLGRTTRVGLSFRPRRS